MRLLLLVVVLIMVIALLSWFLATSNKSTKVTPQPTQISKDLLLPDLKLSSPRELYITSDENGRKIRFTTTFINQGKGPLEVIGKPDLGKNITKATQKILKTDKFTQNKELGEFVYHPTHEHWHIEKYSLFEIWSLKENKDKDKLLATTDKMSFCLWDEEAFDLSLENASQEQKYIGCNNEIQGVSVGWSDTYDVGVEGQEIDIGSIADGNYLTRFIVNPDKNILESDYGNNEVILYINIQGNHLTVENSP